MEEEIKSQKIKKKQVIYTDGDTETFEQVIFAGHYIDAWKDKELTQIPLTAIKKILNLNDGE